MADHEEKHGAEGGGHGGGGGGHKSHGPGGHGGGAHEEHEGAPEWLISFADNVALMMGFFVILLAQNMKPPATGGGGDVKNAPGVSEPSPEMLDWAIAMRQAFNNPVELNSTNPNDKLLVRRLQARMSESEARDTGLMGTEHEVRSIRPGDYFATGGSIPFERDSAALSPTARESIAKLLPELRGHDQIIHIEGNVSAAEAFGLADRGHQLSFERAKAVADALAAAGIPWSQLRTTANGDGDRVVPRAYTETGHRANQCVRITVTARGVPAQVAAEELLTPGTAGRAPVSDEPAESDGSPHPANPDEANTPPSESKSR